MPIPVFTLALAAGAVGVAAVLAAKHRYGTAWFSAGGVLPPPATHKPGSTVSQMTERGTASELVARGRFVRGLDMTRTTINPPHRVTPHWGIDIAAPAGTPVFAVKTGRVLSTALRSGYGQTVALSVGGGQSCLYAHLSSATVRPGQTVIAGQQVGTVGNTTAGPNGVAPFQTTPHLHWEIHPTDPPRFGSARRLDPVVWLRQQGIAQFGVRA